MGEVNTAESKINKVSGTQGKVKVSQGTGSPMVWGWPRFTLNKLLKGQGVGVDPVEIDVPTGNAIINTGSYAGNNTANRAIAHGLGAIPKLVVLVSGADGRAAIIMKSIAFIYQMQVDTFYAVTGATNTNFYVGNAAHYFDSMNANTVTYDWVAIT